MARITWSDVGTGIEVVTDSLDITSPITATEPALVIPMSALASGNLDNVSSMAEVEKVLLALFRQVKTFTKASTNLNDSLIEIDEPRIGTTERVNTSSVTGTFRTLDYAVSFYKPDAITTEFDPDTLNLPTP